MAGDPVERMNYFQFQHLGAEDLALQQGYHRDQRRRHNLGPHSWGVVQGCEISETPRDGDPGFVDVALSPGLAIDGFGREIVLLEPVRIAPELFTAFTGDRVLELWVHYDEYAQRTDADGRSRCLNDGGFSRIVESYRFIVGTLLPEHDPLIVGGLEAKPLLANGTPDGGAPVLPADKSMPAQDFPDVERAAFWPVRLGSVRWDGVAGKFRPVAGPEVLRQSRRTAGFIGASLLAEGQTLLLAPRVPVPVAKVDDADFLTVNGRARVDGRIVAGKDVLLHGGKLSFQAVGGSDETVPLWMRRLGAGMGSGADLHIHIGDTLGEPANRLTIGPGPAPHARADEKIVLAVRADDRIDVPTGTLQFAGPARTAIALAVTDPATGAASGGIGWQGNSLFQRAAGNHYWYGGGVFDPAAGNAGAGGDLSMRLSRNGVLHLPGAYRQGLHFDQGGQDFGVGAQSGTLYARSPANFAWYRGGGHDDAALSSGGGARVMWLDDSSRLTVEGGVRSKGRVELWDRPLAFMTSGGGTDTDPLEIARANRGPDSNDLEVTIGDNLGGDDRLVVGPRIAGAVREQFVVRNDGDVRAAGDIRADGAMAAGGHVSAFGHNLLFDVQAGQRAINMTPGGGSSSRSGTFQLDVSTFKLPRINTAEIMVALSHIRNVNAAVDARWRVEYQPPWQRLSDTQLRFNIFWQVDDTDGFLVAFSYIVILMA
jgi:hypothetical protein